MHGARPNRLPVRLNVVSVPKAGAYAPHDPPGCTRVARFRLKHRAVWWATECGACVRWKCCPGAWHYFSEPGKLWHFSRVTNTVQRVTMRSDHAHPRPQPVQHKVYTPVRNPTGGPNIKSTPRGCISHPPDPDPVAIGSHRLPRPPRPARKGENTHGAEELDLAANIRGVTRSGGAWVGEVYIIRGQVTGCYFELLAVLLGVTLCFPADARWIPALQLSSISYVSSHHFLRIPRKNVLSVRALVILVPTTPPPTCPAGDHTTTSTYIWRGALFQHESTVSCGQPSLQ